MPHGMFELLGLFAEACVERLPAASRHRWLDFAIRTALAFVLLLVLIGALIYVVLWLLPHMLQQH
jgi:hypothetical protein